MIRAILRAQWLSMRMFRMASGRRGAVFSVVVAVLLGMASGRCWR